MSLVVTCYNQERFIRDCLKSVFAQDYHGPMQLVIVDDGSQDRSAEEIRRAIDDFGAGWDVTFVRHERNLGVAGATDTGWSHARHEWIVGVDGDDVQFPDRCSKTAELIARYPDARLVTLSCMGMEADGTVNGCVTTYSSTDGPHIPDEYRVGSHAELFANMVEADGRPVICCMGGCSAVHRSTFLRWGRLQPRPGDEVGAQDRIWTWRCLLSAPACGSRAFGIYYRTHDRNLLNRAWKAGYRGFLERELLNSGFYRTECLSLRTILRDIRRALDEPGLSVWTQEELSQALQAVEKELGGFEMAADWWDIPWRERVRRAFHYRGRVQPAMKNWAWPRLLPRHVAAGLRWFVKAKLRR